MTDKLKTWSSQLWTRASAGLRKFSETGEGEALRGFLEERRAACLDVFRKLKPFARREDMETLLRVQGQLALLDQILDTERWGAGPYIDGWIDQAKGAEEEMRKPLAD